MTEPTASVSKNQENEDFFQNRRKVPHHWFPKKQKPISKPHLAFFAQIY